MNPIIIISSVECSSCGNQYIPPTVIATRYISLYLSLYIQNYIIPYDTYRYTSMYTYTKGTLLDLKGIYLYPYIETDGDITRHRERDTKHR